VAPWVLKGTFQKSGSSNQGLQEFSKIHPSTKAILPNGHWLQQGILVTALGSVAIRSGSALNTHLALASYILTDGHAECSQVRQKEQGF
jgi:hypothetical protein